MAETGDLHRTPLYDMHVEMGAKMVPFAGYEMPVQYPMGVMKEHLHCRAAAGLFDVSHMGQVILRGTDYEAVALAFESLVPMDVLGLGEGRHPADQQRRDQRPDERPEAADNDRHENDGPQEKRHASHSPAALTTSGFSM